MKKFLSGLFKLNIVISVIIILFILSIVVSRIKVYNNIKNKNKILEKFGYSEKTGIFNEAAPAIFGGNVKLKHAVLLLHGYSASPFEFKSLFKEFEKNGIPYYAPLLTGFGQKDFHLLNNIKPEDWIRDALTAYDLLAAFFEEISVIGHSNGSSLAVIVSSERKVKKLILTGPNINVAASDKFYKDILNKPVLSSILKFYMPVFEKPFRKNRITNVDTIDTESALSSFHYSALPINSLAAVWKLQDYADILKAKYESLTVIYGMNDLTVDVNSFLDFLKKNNIKYKDIGLKSSGHNVYDDFDKSEAVSETLKVFNEI